jgi:iron complex transport system substrate-binding protein
MKIVKQSFLFLFLIGLFVQCKKEAQSETFTSAKNTVQYAKGFSIENYNGYSIVTIKKPWPDAAIEYRYILKEKGGKIPDSLLQNTIINIPIKSVVVTSTTHIPSLEMLGVENTLIGFPKLDYISSEKVRALIEADKIKELGSNKSLNTEVLIDLQPDVVIGFGIDNSNPTLENLQKSGLKVMLNGDWNEQTPLGKAEWIKFFGALYGKQKQAEELFYNIEKEYKATAKLALQAKTKPTVMAGALYEDKWYMPQGNSWSSTFLNEANAEYLWKETNGTGSLSLSFEKVLEKAKLADIWIGPSEFTSLSEMLQSNPHYGQFKAFQNKEVYSFSNKKGKTGGVIFYELAPYRPDLVLKDILKIVHPELLPDYQLYFFEKLN